MPASIRTDWYRIESSCLIQQEFSSDRVTSNSLSLREKWKQAYKHCFSNWKTRDLKKGDFFQGVFWSNSERFSIINQGDSSNHWQWYQKKNRLDRLPPLGHQFAIQTFCHVGLLATSIGQLVAGSAAEVFWPWWTVDVTDSSLAGKTIFRQWAGKPPPFATEV